MNAAPATSSSGHPLVGRDPELALLVRALDEVRAGRGQLVIVEGEAGSGRTRLVQEAAEVATRRGMQVAGPSNRLDVVPGWLARATAAAPLLVLLDDLDVPDEGLLANLVGTVPQLRGIPALVLATATGSRQTIAAPVLRLVLGPLPIDAVATLADRTGLDLPARTLERLREATGGNALLVVETLAALARRGPVDEDEPWPLSDRAVAWMRGRLAALPAASRDAVEVASILGEACDVATVAHVLGDGSEAVQVGLALGASLLASVVGGAGRCRFLPSLARDLVQVSLAAQRRAELHTRVAAMPATTAASRLVHRCLAAAALGDARRAEVHLRRLADLAAQPSPASAAPCLACEGEYWVIAFGGRSVQLRARAGLAYLAHLLERPGVEVAALALIGQVRTGTAAVDATRAGGLAAERARVSVTRRIRDAIDQITAVHPALGAHLARTIRTGARCMYLVEPTMAPSWDVRWPA